MQAAHAAGLNVVTGGDDKDGFTRSTADTPARRLLAYVLVKLAYHTFRATMRLLPKEHPFRVVFESAVCRLWDVASQHPRLGILPMDGRPILSRNVVRLWRVALVFALLLVLSDTFAFGPIDLGLIPNVHVGLADALHLPWANDHGAHLFAYDFGS